MRIAPVYNKTVLSQYQTKRDINPIVTKNKKYYGNVNKDKVNFTSLMLNSEYEHLYLDTFFYRDLSTLKSFVVNMSKKFPNGAIIMDFACSNGEEAISIYSLLNNREKYKIFGYDISDIALEYAKRNNYFIPADCYPDAFLLKNESADEEKFNFIKQRFYEVMEEVKHPKVELRDRICEALGGVKSKLAAKCFKIKDKDFDNFSFAKGNILNIQNILPEQKAGAVFFRNALYHITNNHPFDFYVGESMFQKTYETNKSKVLEDFASKIWEKLDTGGFLVLGNSSKDHIYQADKYTPSDNLYFSNNMKDVFYKNSPLIAALEKDGKFKPIFKSLCDTVSHCRFEVYTIWQKVGK